MAPPSPRIPLPQLPLLTAWQRATRRLITALDAELAHLGLSIAEAGVLACIYGGRRRTVRDLVAAMALPPSTLTSVLDRLEWRELIVRTENLADRRSVSVRLTSAGREHAQRVVEASSALERRLPLDDVRRVLATLDEVV